MKNILEEIFILNFFGNWLLGCLVFLLGLSLVALISWGIYTIGVWSLFVLVVLAFGGGIGAGIKSDYLRDKRLGKWK